MMILDAQNQNTEAEKAPKGIWDESLDTSLVLYLDFKSKGSDIFNTVRDQLEDLREKGYLTFWTPETGLAASFKDIIVNTTYRNIFFDVDVGSNKLSGDNVSFDTTNSYSVSTPMSEAIGRVVSERLGFEDQILGCSWEGGPEEEKRGMEKFADLSVSVSAM
ncbi:hypothetical protein BDZ45DRAFT_727136 [Acephala macrosclerotiorum]|nr:hypothetical protein BDZ45DRAFT_727136 [Acephala macrosclerotiorum]